MPDGLDGTFELRLHNPCSESAIVDRAVKAVRLATLHKRPRSWSAYLRLLDLELRLAPLGK